jgi:hypothetical protein
MERGTPVPSQACAGGEKVGYPCVLHKKLHTEKDGFTALAAVFLHWYTTRESACLYRFPFIICALCINAALPNPNFGTSRYCLRTCRLCNSLIARPPVARYECGDTAHRTTSILFDHGAAK